MMQQLDLCWLLGQAGRRPHPHNMKAGIFSRAKLFCGYWKSSPRSPGSDLVALSQVRPHNVLLPIQQVLRATDAGQALC